MYSNAQSLLQTHTYMQYLCVCAHTPKTSASHPPIFEGVLHECDAVPAIAVHQLTVVYARVPGWNVQPCGGESGYVACSAHGLGLSGCALPEHLRGEHEGGEQLRMQIDCGQDVLCSSPVTERLHAIITLTSSSKVQLVYI